MFKIFKNNARECSVYKQTPHIKWGFLIDKTFVTFAKNDYFHVLKHKTLIPVVPFHISKLCIKKTIHCKNVNVVYIFSKNIVFYKISQILRKPYFYRIFEM